MCVCVCVCVQVETNSSVNCSSISSISEHCLNPNLARERAEKAISSLANNGLKLNAKEHPRCWLTQFHQDSSPDSEVWEALLENISMQSYNCTLTCNGVVDCTEPQ